MGGKSKEKNCENGHSHDTPESSMHDTLSAMLKKIEGRIAELEAKPRPQKETSPQDTCPDCNGRGGRTVVTNKNVHVWVHCHCHLRQVFRAKLKNAGIPFEYWDFELPLVEEVEAYACLDIKKDEVAEIDINAFLESYTDKLTENMRTQKNVLLFGNNGSGKTFASVIILKEAIRRGYTAKYTTMKRYLNQKFNYKDEEAVAEAELCREVDVLLLDDIGKEFHSNSGIAALVEIEDLLRYRFTQKKITILTSNYNPFDNHPKGSSVEAVHQQSILSLLSAYCLPLYVLIGEDYRLEVGRKLWSGFDIKAMEVKRDDGH